jgi:DNA-directed RNA polymerase specialized sigma24 family protein
MSKPTVAQAFPATMWSCVQRTRDEASAVTALDQLCKIYWKPVVSYVRALGCHADEAEDVAQDFFATFLRREGFQRADQQRGTLRSYLKTALRYQVMHWRRHGAAQRRTSGVPPIELDAEDAPELPANDAAAGMYDTEWAVTVMERALAALKLSYEKRGKSDLFLKIKPTLMSADHGDGVALANSVGIQRGTFAVEQHRARRRLAELLRAEVAQTTSDPTEIEAELLHLLRVLAQTEAAD